MLPVDHTDKGFTLIEVIAVLVIAGIIAAVAIFKISSAKTFSVAAEAATLKTQLRFAQIKALGETGTWGIQVNGNSYQLINVAAGNVVSPATINLPAETSNTHSFSGAVTATATQNPITFDNFGNPGAANISITLTSGSQTAVVNITNTTGFIQ
jgi:MSHA pilin protein MshC